MKLSQIYVENSKDYKNPSIVAQLPPKLPISDHQVETVEDVNIISISFRHMVMFLLKYIMMEHSLKKLK